MRCFATAALLCLGCTIGPVRAAPWAYVTNQGSDDVSIVDGERLTETARVPVGRSPAGVSVSEVAGRAYISNPDGPSLSAIELASGRVVAEVVLPGAVVGIATSPDGRRVYAADWYAHRLRVFDAGLAPVGSVAVGHAPAGIAVSAAGDRIYVANRDDNDVTVIDADGLRPLARIGVGEHPFALALTPDGQRLLAANVVSNDVSVIDLAGAREIARVPVGSAPYGIAFDGDGARARAFVTNQHADSLSVIDMARLEVAATWPTAEYPEGVAWSPRRVWVVSWMEERLQVLDDTSGRPLGSVGLGSNPRGFGNFLSHTAPRATAGR